MNINEVIAHLKMLKFKHQLHQSPYFFELVFNRYHIRITISIKRMHIWSHKLTDTPGIKTSIHKSVRTGHEQGLNFLVKYLHNIEQETK